MDEELNNLWEALLTVKTFCGEQISGGERCDRCPCNLDDECMVNKDFPSAWELRKRTVFF